MRVERNMQRGREGECHATPYVSRCLFSSFRTAADQRSTGEYRCRARPPPSSRDTPPRRPHRPAAVVDREQGEIEGRKNNREGHGMFAPASANIQPRHITARHQRRHVCRRKVRSSCHRMGNVPRPPPKTRCCAAATTYHPPSDTFVIYSDSNGGQISTPRRC